MYSTVEDRQSFTPRRFLKSMSGVKILFSTWGKNKNGGLGEEKCSV
jgi:hypothetical protein